MLADATVTTGTYFLAGSIKSVLLWSKDMLRKERYSHTTILFLMLGKASKIGPSSHRVSKPPLHSVDLGTVISIEKVVKNPNILSLMATPPAEKR